LFKFQAPSFSPWRKWLVGSFAFLATLTVGVFAYAILAEIPSPLNLSASEKGQVNPGSLKQAKAPIFVQNLPESFEFDIICPDSSVGATSFEGFSASYASDSSSIFCFRGNHQRNRPSRGTISTCPDSISLDWQFKTGYDGTQTEYGMWGGGAGWTGQPLLVKWTKDQKHKLGISDPDFLKNDQALEVIIGSLCGDIYFLDSETGKPTREKMSIGNPIKGTVSVDPRKNGILYVGQGIQHGSQFGAHILDMFARKEIFYQPGRDRHAKRQWGAFDSNPLVDHQTGTVFWPAENGLVYRFKLDSSRTVNELTKVRYHHEELFRQGIESSMSVMGNFGFFTDNSGTVVCLNLSTLEPIWMSNNGDDSDASVTLDEEEDGMIALYTGNEVDKKAPISEAIFRKLDAATGKELWRVKRRCSGTELQGKTNSGGVLASPVIGKMAGKNLVYCVFSRVDSRNRGEFIAIDKATGKEAFNLLMDHYSWSSPVDVYDELGNIYIFLTDVIGNVYLLDGLTGELLIKQKTPFTFESSPIAVNDRIVIASRGHHILSFKLHQIQR
jgi:outer membrane protein assembly factor BamB